MLTVYVHDKQTRGKHEYPACQSYSLCVVTNMVKYVYPHM